ncbi:Fur family transcriptional regulator [Blastopirellula marina]|uniref:Fur family transcriptional regulator n=1 Tax=Blastopirellula marina TaxID=124 RepID=A0A2S8G0Q9_9BACT|nr:Fur family transcriptional regulator [Blastopirellula marina]PQO38028.1 Fur family transcriptional regulator [Blastopirellula marina]PTL44684.1 transcriptional repressor [Blastopirellula marina]
MARGRNSALSIDSAKSLLREAGLRCTAARIGVIQSLSDSNSPMSPNEVAEDLVEFGFDKSTIYRSLTELDESGLVVRLELGEAVRRYELLPNKGNATSNHPHFLCITCGKVLCLTGFHVDVVADSGTSEFSLELTEVLLKGRCEACC